MSKSVKRAHLRFSTEKKQLLFHQVRCMVADYIERCPPGINSGKGGQCLPIAMFGVALAERVFPRGQFAFQAGTAFWRAAPSYELGWEWCSRRSHALNRDPSRLRLGEMHCWFMEVKTRSIIDLSTWRIPELFKTPMHPPWIAPHPPDFIWMNRRRLPCGATYEPNLDAIKHASSVWEQTNAMMSRDAQLDGKTLLLEKP